MRFQIQQFALALCLILAVTSDSTAAVTLLHNFAGGAGDGGRPFSGLTLGGSTLYGGTYEGGDSDNGVLYKLNTDGTGYQLLREFAGGVSDGSGPGVPTLVGNTLYGTTSGGGDVDAGTLFKINTDGSGYQILHEFQAGAIDGGSPNGPLTLIGNSLYGTSGGAETGNKGTVFKINTDGTGYQVLHSFVGGVDDGRSPGGPLTAIGSTLYSTTLGGGDFGRGTLYKINTDGSGFQLVHEFAGGVNDGDFPAFNLLPIGPSLFGTAAFGGDSNQGVIFKINPDGSGFSLIHEFAGGANDGYFPSSGLILFGNRLRGATAYGGDLDRGTVYELNSDGTDFKLNYEFVGGANDGQSPQDNLVGSGTNLYGVTSDGGTNDSGTVFALSLVGVPGDYSGNGTVGNEDYNLWRTNFGSDSNLAADGNHNKVVDAADYIIWRNNRTSGAAAAVPEPAALLLACTAFSFICRRARS